MFWKSKMVPYKDIKHYGKQNMSVIPWKKVPEVIVMFLVLSLVVLVILFALTNNGMTKKTVIHDTKVYKGRSFTGRKPKVYRASDVDMDPLRIASPYYTMTIPSNSSCKEKIPVFSVNKLPRTAMVSYAGSGSTWVRHLVQQLTGIATGSSSCKKRLKQSKSFSLGECINDDHVILVSSNDRYRRRKFERKFDKLIILYRDPFETLRSAYTMKHPGHSESVDSEIFNVRGWYEFVRDHTTMWENYYSEWLEAETPVFLLFYDDLINNLQGVLKRLAYFLEWKISKKDIKCTVVTSEGHFHRRHVHNITNSEIFVGKLWHKLEDAEYNIASEVDERRHSGSMFESGKRLKNILKKNKDKSV